MRDSYDLTETLPTWADECDECGQLVREGTLVTVGRLAVCSECAECAAELETA